MKDAKRRRKQSIRFFTLGCKANQYDTQSIRERFLTNGFRETEDSGGAGFFLINTCTVTSGADQKSRNLIRRCAKTNPKAKLIVTGCLAERDWRGLADIKGVDLVVKKCFFPEGISSFRGHTRAFLKIQDGCANFCAYCKVALVRGKERSKSIGQIAREAKELVSRGYKEIVLTGICLGAYGRGLSPRQDLIDVIEALEQIEGLERIRLSSIEAGDISPELVSRMRSSKKLCRHLHIPVQSGDDGILKLMNRKYTAKEFQKLIAGIKRDIPEASITTDCLVGFPGETEKGFGNTLNLVQAVVPLNTHIFPYSVRPGTRSAGMKGAVDPKIVRQRCRRLKKTAGCCRRRFMARFVGKAVLVLVEGAAKDKPGYLEGLTDNYLKVKLPFNPGIVNNIVRARLISLSGDSFIGEYIDKS